MKEAPRPSRQGRLPALDGLRGLAALIVVLHHALLTSRDLAEAQVGRPVSGAFERLLACSPLHVAWAGGEAVMVFFVLSGCVLALPYANGARIDLNEYYARRLIRLYLPVWGALVLAVGLKLLVPHRIVEGGSWWLNAHSAPLRASEIAREALLVFGAGGFSTNSVLWSLSWEVLFSLLLPFFVAAMTVTRRRPALLVLGLAALSSSAELAPKVPDAIRYFPMFCVGVVLAIELPRLRTAGARLTALPRPNLVWAALGAAALIALTARWSLTPLTRQLPARAALLVAMGTSLLALLGAAGAVMLTLTWSGWREQMERPSLRWAGQYSYSVYLVHEPILVSLAFAFGVTTNPLPVLLLGVPTSILAAYGLHRWVEAPSMRLAARVGRRCGELGRIPARERGSHPSIRVDLSSPSRRGTTPPSIATRISG